MTPRRTRFLIRTLHLLLGATVGAVVYLPAGWVEPWRPLLGFVVVPILVASGLALWQQARLRRLFGGAKRSRPASDRPSADAG